MTKQRSSKRSLLSTILAAIVVIIAAVISLLGGGDQQAEREGGMKAQLVVVHDRVPNRLHAFRPQTDRTRIDLSMAVRGDLLRVESAHMPRQKLLEIGKLHQDW